MGRTLGLVSATILFACGGPREPAGPIDVRVGEPAPPPPAFTSLPTTRPTMAEPVVESLVPTVDPERSDVLLPSSWVEPKGLAVSFADAMKRAREARDGFGNLEKPPPVADVAAPEPAAKAWFIKAEALVDRASRSYATAFHASDASREGRIDAMAEAADLDALLARRLDEMGVAVLPGPWKTDPQIRATFEDVAHGPFKRWRDEARVLARRCVEIAQDERVATPAVKRCAAIRSAPVANTKTVTKDSKNACPCVAGDPLCSASIGGWCAARAP